jgi:hypothetical protein
MSSSTDADVGDIFAGCFLSLAGSLVGSVIGAVALLLRMLPELRMAELVLGFLAGFVVGVVVGFIATFAAAPLAIRLGRSHAENIWIGAVAIAAATGAAVTAWLLIAV